MRIINKPSPDLWQHIVDQCEYATFFHTPTWAQIVTTAYPRYEIATRGFVLDDGDIAIVPMVNTTERNRWFKWCESMFPGGYGGAVAARLLAEHETHSIFRQLTTWRTAYIHVMGNPYQTSSLPQEYKPTEQFTHILDLSNGFQAIQSNYASTKKRDIKKAAKSGIQIRIAETEQEYRAYYDVYLDTLERWNETTLARYPYCLFEQMFKTRSSAIQLWLARTNNEVISGMLVFYHNHNASYWHGATCKSYLDHHPAPLLMNEIIADACRRGLRYFDLGPSGGLKGVERYKEEFGAHKKPFYSYVWAENKLHHAYPVLRGLGQRAQDANHQPEESRR